MEGPPDEFVACIARAWSSIWLARHASRSVLDEDDDDDDDDDDDEQD
jgi:hypothetical protein